MAKSWEPMEQNMFPFDVAKGVEKQVSIVTYYFAYTAWLAYWVQYTYTTYRCQV